MIVTGLLPHIIREYMEQMQKPYTFAPVHLDGKVRQHDIVCQVDGYGHVAILGSAPQLRIERGTLCKKDLVIWKSSDDVCLGSAECFFIAGCGR